MDQLRLPNGVEELKEWLDRSGGRTGRLMGVRRARWEDWSVVHRLAVTDASPFHPGFDHLTRVADGLFELRATPSANASALLAAGMLFFESNEGAAQALNKLFAFADVALTRSAAHGAPLWLVVDLALEDADLDPEECLQALANDRRLAHLAFFEYCAVFVGRPIPYVIGGGVLRSLDKLH